MSMSGRQSKNKNCTVCIDSCIMDRISAANGEIYALMGAGMHGSNGLPTTV